MADKAGTSSSPGNNLQTPVPEAAPRNEHGEIYCNYLSCQGKSQTFKRPSEWKKHVDQHERPHKCLEAICQGKPGFPSSGGLRRHQREVHEAKSNPTSVLDCPVAFCNRSSSRGFARKWNLNQHIRTQHASTSAETSSHPAASPPPATTPTETAAGELPVEGDGSLGSTMAMRDHSNNDNIGASDSFRVRQLRKELQQKDRVIQQQAIKIERLERRQTEDDEE